MNNNLWSSYNDDRKAISAIKKRITTRFFSSPKNDLRKKVTTHERIVSHMSKVHNFIRVNLTFFLILAIVALFLIMIVKFIGLCAVESGTLRNFINGGLI